MGHRAAHPRSRTERSSSLGTFPDLSPIIGPAAGRLEDAFANGERILLEGTQGTMLSLYHGEYPHVTSRDTTVAGCLAEAGIPPRRVRRVIMVCRTYPIRVQSPEGSTSGYMSQALAWDEIAERSGIDARRAQESREGVGVHKQRRVAEFDWALLRKAAQTQRANRHRLDIRRLSQRRRTGKLGASIS